MFQLIYGLTHALCLIFKRPKLTFYYFFPIFRQLYCHKQNFFSPPISAMLLGLSTETRYPTHPKKPSDPAREPSDPTLVTVGGGSPPPEPVTGRSVAGFSLPKSEKPEPTGENP